MYVNGDKFTLKALELEKFQKRLKNSKKTKISAQI